MNTTAMSSTTSTTPTPAAASAAATNKRKDPSEPPAVAVATVTPKAGASPFEIKLNQLETIRESNPGYVLWNIMGSGNHVLLERIPGKLEELGVDSVEDLSDEEEIQQALHQLTAEQVDEHMVYFLMVPESVGDHFDRCRDEILYADTRNNKRGDGGFLMLDTHSSWCMMPVIEKQLKAATKEINKALKSIASRATVDARLALEKTVAAVFACNDCDHWRLDTECPGTYSTYNIVDTVRSLCPSS